MRICPQCGGPFMNNAVIEGPTPVTCDRCDWDGTMNDTLLVDDDFAGVGEHQRKLELFYQDMAREVAPIIGKLLINRGLVKGPDGIDKDVDAQRIQFLAKVLQGSTGGACQGIASVIAEEMNHGRN